MGSTEESPTAWQQAPDVSGSLAVLKQTLLEEAINRPDGRKGLIKAARSLADALETPGESVTRLSYVPLQTVVLQIGINLDLFNIFAQSGEPLSTEHIAEQTGADPALIQRVLRFLAAIPAIKEVGPSLFTANSLTRTLTRTNMAAGVLHNMLTCNPAWAALPSFLEKNNYRNPSDVHDCSFQSGHSTSDGIFEWFPKNPTAHKEFMLWMTGQREGRGSWLDFFLFDERIADGFRKDDPDAVMLVDIGGGIGHEIRAIKDHYPSLHGRFILQDTPKTLEQALTVPSMEAMEYDFFTKQPVIGARTYYLRNVLHDWPYAQSISILKNIAAAMTPGYSKLLLNEFVIPDQGAGIVGTMVDFTMMSVVGSEERSEGQWRRMIEDAGLRVVRVWTGNEEEESVIEVELV
ncbi:MAG: hypothetical protein Q9226_007126 [Calogaya cf. arnoldii]